MNWKYFHNVSTLEQARKVYRDTAKRCHPDLGGSVEAMQELNAEYERICNYLNQAGNNKQEFKGWEWDNEAALMSAVQAGLRLGLGVEIIGSWVWFTGNTRPLKDILKSRGFQWSRKRQQWYWSPTVRKKGTKYQSKLSMDDIRAKYGSRVVRRYAG